MPITILNFDTDSEEKYYPRYNNSTRFLNHNIQFNWTSLIKVYDPWVALEIGAAIAVKWWLEKGTDCMIVMSDLDKSVKEDFFAKWTKAQNTFRQEEPKLLVNIAATDFGLDIAKAREIPNFVNIQWGKYAYLLGDSYDYKLKSYTNLIDKDNYKYTLQNHSGIETDIYSANSKNVPLIY
jgi:hypothetical protein